MTKRHLDTDRYRYGHLGFLYKLWKQTTYFQSEKYTNCTRYFIFLMHEFIMLIFLNSLIQNCSSRFISVLFQHSRQHQHNKLWPIFIKFKYCKKIIFYVSCLLSIIQLEHILVPENYISCPDAL